MKYGDNIQLLHEESQNFVVLEEGETDRRFSMLHYKEYILGLTIYTSEFTHFQIDPYCEYQSEGSKNVASAHNFYLNYMDPIRQMKEATAMIEEGTIYFTQFESETSAFKFKQIEGFQDYEGGDSERKGVGHTNVFRLHFAGGSYYLNAFYNHNIKHFDAAFLKFDDVNTIDRNGYWLLINTQTEGGSQNQIQIKNYLYI